MLTVGTEWLGPRLHLCLCQPQQLFPVSLPSFRPSDSRVQCPLPESRVAAWGSWGVEWAHSQGLRCMAGLGAQQAWGAWKQHPLGVLGWVQRELGYLKCECEQACGPPPCCSPVPPSTWWVPSSGRLPSAPPPHPYPKASAFGLCLWVLPSPIGLGPLLKP